MSKKQDEELLVVADIRKALGCGDKPMLSDLPDIIKHTRELALVVYRMHEGEERLLAGFSKPKPCLCAECEFCRKWLGVK